MILFYEYRLFMAVSSKMEVDLVLIVLSVFFLFYL